MRATGILPAPEWQISRWFNTPQPLSIAVLKGKVIVLHSFQMLCPGCVIHGLPQTQKIANLFDENDVAVIGLHTVFEHHNVMTPEALEAFIHEYRYTFPIGVDQPDGKQGLPYTMRTYNMQGTPSLVLIDHQGYIRKHSFGRDEDMQVGAEIALLVHEAKVDKQSGNVTHSVSEENSHKGCDEDKCSI
ncbi:peroxiredoxin family protein [Candidatus Nitrosacidococcus tergens]|uniref:Alkyl hydroperoxide reductase/ Thiol specific antioxidant/ Mal allergen n=1 Tax=Candidatus Nitrosacidococcus tergens TaxID=553981 RepID=A0A7G1Q9B5_9GAMM|nr:redoxin domain-containing protein [Candidatus Nitrosacidococcus tergens]CAB1275641.1 Alkyl hydroperoxide reductase/ Thiol specific antioxidant/ Mal allergen [Candidatus Nitrosacidococcus tergens]